MNEMNSVMKAKKVIVITRINCSHDLEMYIETHLYVPNIETS